MARSRLAIVPAHVERRILLLRGERVMLDADLASLYSVETRLLVRAVKRNRERFPADFMFQLTADEVANLRSQTGISSASHGGRRYAPYAFTEHGVAMLAAVLQSPRAVQVSVRRPSLVVGSGSRRETRPPGPHRSALSFGTSTSVVVPG
jgi:hypothetical protein